MVWLDEGGLGRSSAQLLAPPPALASWVEHFWIERGRKPLGRPWRIVPDAGAHVIFAVELKPGAGERARCLVVGSRGVYDDIDVSRRVLTIGARLRPGALPALVRSEARGFTDRAFRTEDVFGKAGRALAGRMNESTPEIAVGHLESFLESRFRSVKANVQLQSALRSGLSVARLADAMGVSLRGIRNSTMAKTGLGPRHLLRIVRLHRALHHAAASSSTWSEIAYLSGFADQSHMIREFVALLGEPPNAWRNRGRADSFNTTAVPSLQS